MSDQSGGYSSVAQPPSTPGFPQNPLPIVFSGFTGLNTKASEQGIQDQEMFVCDGFMPLGPNNLRCLYGIGDTFYTSPTGTTIESHSFNNIGDNLYAIVSLSNGAIEAYLNGSVIPVAAAGTITAFRADFSQWADQYIIIVAPQTNGYFLWDGTVLYKAGTIAPTITITNSGSGYTGPPTITMSNIGAVAMGDIDFSGSGNPSPGDTVTLNSVVWTFVAGAPVGNQIEIQGVLALTLDVGLVRWNASVDPLMTVATYSDPTGSALKIVYDTSGAIGNSYTLAASAASPSAGTLTGGVNGGAGATFSGTVANGSLVGVTVTNPGTGFQPGDVPILTIIGGGSDDMASATPVISADSGVSSVIVNNGGQGYSNLVQVTASSGGASIDATFSVVGQNGVITQVNVENPGIGYTSVPVLTVADLASGAVGTGAILTAVLTAGQIASVTVDTHGTGYTSAPTLTIVGDGVGAVLQANISGSVLDSITVVNAGAGYTQAALEFSGGNRGASATAFIMPFGVSGTTVETYQSRVWVGNGRNGQVGAPSDPADFSAANGATSFQSTDSFLRQRYTKFIQSNGFLYLFADSSINYISGVNTSGNPVVTTFSNLNVDPQVGSPWQGTVQLFGRDIVFANPVGVFVSYGGAVTKVSDALDGIYTTVPQSDWPDGFEPSAAVMTIFGIRCYILALPIIDQVTKQQVVKCLMWDSKRWWTSPQQGFTAPFLASQDFDSTLNAYASINQTQLAKLFTTPTQEFTRYLYSKLWDSPGIFQTKMQRELFGSANVNVFDPSPTVATGSIFFAINPSPGDTITLNSVVWTFVSGAPTGTQIEIQGNVALTLDIGILRLNASTNPLMSVATYSDPTGSAILVTYDTAGTDGNAYTLAASAAVPSGPTLTGGSTGPIIYLAPITENGIGNETSVTSTKLGPFVFGPLKSVEPGRLVGITLRTTMEDIQINMIVLINQIMQSDV